MCARLVAIALAAGDVEERGAGEVFADLREPPATVIFFYRLIVEYDESHIWLVEHLAAHVSVDALANELPGPFDDSEYEVR